MGRLTPDCRTGRDRDNSPTDPPTRAAALVLAAIALVALAGGAVAYALLAPDVPHLVAVELGSWHYLEQYDPTVGRPVLRTADLHASLLPDLLFIAGYGTTLLIGCSLATHMAWTPLSRKVACLGLVLSAVVILTDLVEDLFLYLGRADRTWAFDVAAGAATIKWSMLVPAGLIAVVGLYLTPVRAIGNSAKKFTDEARQNDPLMQTTVRPPAPVAEDGSPAGRWLRAYGVPDIPDPAAKDVADGKRIAICLSGGGVRSASVALGALQALRPKLLAAKYVISVSGGGYTSGAFIQALAGTGADDPELVRDPERVFAPGSVEEDHVRRHSSYLADTPARMVVALGILARGLLATLFLVFAPAVILGVLMGAFYRYVPVAPLAEVRVPAGDSTSLPYPQPATPALVALAIMAAVALVCWAQGIALQPYGSDDDGRLRRGSARVTTASRWASAATGVLALFVIGLPALTWSCTWLYTALGHGPAVAVGGPVLSVLLSYFATVGATLWRHKDKIPVPAAAAGGDGGKKSVAAAVPRSMLQLLMVVAVLTLLGLVWLVVFGVSGSSHASAESLWTALIILAVWSFMAGLVDETAISLHPFYRARIASAFALRIVRRDGREAVRPYDFAMSSRLDRFAKTSARYPTVVFAAAANLVDDEVTAPGLRAVSYVLSGDWIGGPDVGWLKTSEAIEACPVYLKRDLTVQAAVAISGAAFASAMGRASAWYETLLALSGARLGSWLPHPEYVRKRQEALDRGDWRRPGFPRVRRFPYLVREIFGVHPNTERLLHVTDGGHYENLGLVEALRRRCREIYVVDASGDSPPSASTFAEAIRLARDELGVRITLTDPWLIEPGSGAELEPTDPLSALNHRLAETPVVRGEVVYPAESGLPEGKRIGEVVFVKARLWSTLPYEVLSYAAKHDVFPNDSTADQWFDEGQFSQYKRLGHLMGELAVNPPPAPPAGWW